MNKENGNLQEAIKRFRFPKLPDSWCWATVGDLGEVRLGRQRSPKNRSDKYPTKYIRAANLTWNGLDLSDVLDMEFTPDQRETYRLRSGDVVLAEASGSPGEVGKPAVWNDELDECCFQNTVIRFRPAVPTPKFANFVFGHYARNGIFTRTGKGVGIHHLSAARFSKIPFPVAPLNEQERIVAKIEELFSDLDAGVAALERAKANLKRYRAAVLKAAVEGKLTTAWRAENPVRSARVSDPAETADRRSPASFETCGQSSGSVPKPATAHVESASDLLPRILHERRQKWEQQQLATYEAKGKKPPKGWRDKYKPPAEPDATNLPKLPSGWCWANMGQCFDIHVGATPSRKEPSYWNGDVSWVSSGEIQFCRINHTKETITESGLANSSTQLNPPGSVLLGMIGEGRTRGQVAMLDVAACNNQNCAAICVSQTPIVPEYVYYWLWSQYEVTRKGSSGNNQPALNKARVEQILLPLPPTPEQVEIVRELDYRLTIVEKSELNAATGLKRATRLRQSILKRAFEGKLVPQDPTDEPASELLERIRIEGLRTTAVASRSKRRNNQGRR